MSVSNYIKVLRKLQIMGIKQITLSGGEPTEHPDFEEFLKLSAQYNFILNIASHGDWSYLGTFNVAKMLKKYGVKQVQFNYQGELHHDKVHGVKGSYQEQLNAIELTKIENIDVVNTVTVGKYNLDNIKETFEEMINTGVDRLRVWETTGFGNNHRKNIEAQEIFDKTGKVAKELGYNYVQSYDPLVQGNCGVSCLSKSMLFMYINHKCEHIYCGAVPSQLSRPMSNILIDTPEDIIENYRKLNENVPYSYCMAREL